MQRIALSGSRTLQGQNIMNKILQIRIMLFSHKVASVRLICKPGQLVV